MLNIWYEIADSLPDGAPVDAREWKGEIGIRLSRTASLDDIAKALNALSTQILGGGQWFQLWQGEIVSMSSPGEDTGGHSTTHPDAEGEADGGLHRGPVA